MLFSVKSIAKCLKKRISIIKGDRKKRIEEKNVEKIETAVEEEIEIVEEENIGINDRVWIAEADEGVLLTLVSMPNRYKRLKRVRFSKAHFNPVEAEQWWADNYESLMELHCIHPEHPLPDTLGFGEESASPIIEEEAADKTTLLVNEDDSAGVSVNCMPDGYKEAARFEMSGEMFEKQNQNTLDSNVCSSESSGDDDGQCMKLDGSYCCAACENVSGTIGCRKHLANGSDEQRLCSLAIEKEDEWISPISSATSDSFEFYCNVVKPEATKVQQEPTRVVPRILELNADVIAPAEGSAEEENEVNSSPLKFSNGVGRLDDMNEYCVKVIRWLDCRGHIEKDFRIKFLTWFCLRSNEQERTVVISFMRALADEPSSLAAQLIDLFSEIVSCKRSLKKGFCSKLLHSIRSAFRS